MRHLFPSAEIAVIDNAGHWLHAERPAAFLAIVDAFLRQ
jgi:pimeloyl-ACP methyl ester carboxylesterase